MIKSFACNMVNVPNMFCVWSSGTLLGGSILMEDYQRYVTNPRRAE